MRFAQSICRCCKQACPIECTCNADEEWSSSSGKKDVKNAFSTIRGSCEPSAKSASMEL